METNEDILALLHTALCKELLKRVESGDAKANDLGVAVRFLKDNGIEAIPTGNSPLQQLLESLPFDEDAAVEEQLEEQLVKTPRH
jgi:hypothetical protein